VRGWRRERLEAKVLAERWQHLKRKRVALPLLHLEPSLLTKPGERHFVDSVDRLVDRTGAELGHRFDAGEVQPTCLVATHARDQAEMVVLAAASLADVDPAADPAVVNRIWIGRHGRRKHRLLELALHAPVVGRIVLQPQLFLGAVAKDQRNVLRLNILNGGDLLGVDAALEDSRRLRLPGQLGVGDLVAVGAELAGAVDPQQEVGMATPAAVEEGALVDDVDTLAHRSDGLGVSLGKAGGRAVRERELDHSAVARSQGGQMASFVLETSPGQYLK